MGPVIEKQSRARLRTVAACAAILGTAGLLAFATATSIVGCAKQSPVQAESREIRLTEGGGFNGISSFSPDGRLIAYTSKPDQDGSKYSINLIPARGGEVRVIRADSSGIFPVSWSGGGQGLYVYSEEDHSVRLMTLSGDFLESYPRPQLSRITAVSPDGKHLLYRQFVGDNSEIGIMSAMGDEEPRLLAETPGWERAACFGPGPGEVTVVTQAVYGSSTTELFVWSPETREYRPIPMPKASNQSPSWSQDGRYLAYASDQAGNTNIWALDSVTGRTIQITAGPEEDGRPNWSPDAEWITFTRTTYSSHIFIVNVENNESWQLSKGKDRDFMPQISEDGRWVAFMRHQTDGENRAGGMILCVGSLDEREVRPLDLPGLTVNSDAGLSWSPDAEQIAFAADDGTGNVDIYRVGRDGAGLSRVTVTPGVDIIPSWSPDGRTLAFTRCAGGETQVWAIPATGGIAKQITFGDGVDQSAVWSPDSRDIAFISAQIDGSYEVHVAAVASPGPSFKISGGESLELPVTWSADGERVLVWRKQGELSTLYSVARDGSDEVCIGEEPWETYLKKHYVPLNAEGLKYRDVLYPRGIHAYEDGESISDVYVLRVAELLRNELSASDLGAVR